MLLLLKCAEPSALGHHYDVGHYIARTKSKHRVAPLLDHSLFCHISHCPLPLPNHHPHPIQSPYQASSNHGEHTGQARAGQEEAQVH